MTLHEEYMDVVNSLVKNNQKKLKISAVILAGSVARAEENRMSDIDILFIVDKKDLPKDIWRFYNYKGKYIEEHYESLQDWDRTILKENKILYNTGLKINYFDKKYFLKKLLEAHKKYKSFNTEKISYDTFQNIYDMGGFAYEIVHNLPPLYDKPFPSLRLFESIKKIDEKLYDLCMKCHYIENPNSIDLFEKAYKIRSNELRKKNSHINLGFYAPSKIKYNIEYFRYTAKHYPKQYADRFLVGCMARWTDNKKIAKLFDKLIGDKEKFIRDKLKFYKEFDDRTMFLIKKYQ